MKGAAPPGLKGWKSKIQNPGLGPKVELGRIQNPDFCLKIRSLNPEYQIQNPNPEKFHYTSIKEIQESRLPRSNGIGGLSITCRYRYRIDFNQVAHGSRHSRHKRLTALSLTLTTLARTVDTTTDPWPTDISWTSVLRGECSGRVEALAPSIQDPTRCRLYSRSYPILLCSAERVRAADLAPQTTQKAPPISGFKTPSRGRYRGVHGTLTRNHSPCGDARGRLREKRASERFVMVLCTCDVYLAKRPEP